ncbi:MAG: thermonuclease family protein [Candidatus Methanomethylicia archaeon]
MALAVFAIVLGFFLPAVGALRFEVDVVDVVTYVVDGDTFDCYSVGRIRLADINAPELGTAAGEVAKDKLRSLILNKVVYLDVDDIYVYDPYGRIVAVAYIRYNSTHLLNVNRWLVDNRYAVIKDYDNEFNPYLWSTYVYYPEQTATQGNVTITKTVTTSTTVTKTTTVSTTRTLTQTVTVTSWTSIITVKTEKVITSIITTVLITPPTKTVTETNPIMDTRIIILVLVIVVSTILVVSYALYKRKH